jgi:hypothetical protein
MEIKELGRNCRYKNGYIRQQLLCLIKLIINLLSAGALQLDEAGPLELKE